jgi:hypothetical protein
MRENTDEMEFKLLITVSIKVTYEKWEKRRGVNKE